MIEIYLTLSLIAFGICKGISDGLAHDLNFDDSWWSNHWKNKYKRDGDYPEILLPYHSKWYYLGLHTPEFEERFPYSSTVLVFITDAWHFFNFIRYRIVYSYIALVLDLGIWWSLGIVFIFAPILMGGAFELTYRKVK